MQTVTCFNSVSCFILSRGDHDNTPLPLHHVVAQQLPPNFKLAPVDRHDRARPRLSGCVVS